MLLINHTFIRIQRDATSCYMPVLKSCLLQMFFLRASSARPSSFMNRIQPHSHSKSLSAHLNDLFCIRAQERILMKRIRLEIRNDEALLRLCGTQTLKNFKRRHIHILSPHSGLFVVVTLERHRSISRSASMFEMHFESSHSLSFASSARLIVYFAQVSIKQLLKSLIRHLVRLIIEYSSSHLSNISPVSTHHQRARKKQRHATKRSLDDGTFRNIEGRTYFCRCRLHASLFFLHILIRFKILLTSYICPSSRRPHRGLDEYELRFQRVQVISTVDA